MESLEKILKQHPFLRDLDDRYITLLTGCATNVAFKPNQFLFREGEQADYFYIIREGKIIIETYIPEKGSIAIQTRGKDDVTGWSWLIPPYRWHFDARAAEQTRAIALDGKCLRAKCEEDHDFGYILMKRFAMIIAERLEATRIQLLDIYGSGHKK